MDYHKSHSNSLRLACIVSGERDISPFAIGLARYFACIHIHSPKHEMQHAARKLASTHYAKHWEQGRFTFSNGPPDAVHQYLARQSVDLVIFESCTRDVGLFGGGNE